MLRFLLLFAAAVLCLPLSSAAQLLPAAYHGRGTDASRAVPLLYRPQAAPPVIQSKLDQAIGRRVYSCHRTGLILLDAVEQDGKPVLYYGGNANPAESAYMSPWKVIGIDRLNDVAGWSFFGLRLIVNGSVMVMNGIAVSPAELQSSPDLFEMLANKAGLFTSVAASRIPFTDLHAVQTGEIHRGMSEQEVACALGPPERSDVEDSGLRKDIYQNGSLAIDISGGSVTGVERHALPRPEEHATK